MSADGDWRNSSDRPVAARQSEHRIQDGGWRMENCRMEPYEYGYESTASVSRSL